MIKISLSLLTFILLIVFLHHVSFAESTTQYAKCPEMFQEGQCSFTIAEWEYHVNSEGTGYRTNNKNKRQEFDLQLNKHDTIEGIQYAQLEKDIILIYGVTDGEGAACSVSRLDGQKLDRKWSAWVPAFNISTGFIESNYLYLAGIGFVSKINLETGEFEWKHDNLYDNKYFSFNSFETPKIIDNEVIFLESIPTGIKFKKPREIRVNNNTGKITIY